MPLPLVFALCGCLQAQSSPTAAAFTFGAPTTITELDGGMLDGELTRVAWSPDGASIYLQTAQRDRRRHLLVTVAGDGKPAAQTSEPDWAAQYWDRKASLAAPGAHVAISVLHEVQKKDSSFLGGAPNLAGSLDREPTPEYDDVVVYEVYAERIGRWVRVPAVQGQTYGWGPEGTGTIAFVDMKGQLVVRRADAREIAPRIADASLPAWSPDGSKIAYIQKTGRRKFVLAYVTIK
jgi:hypothetical protein